MSDLDEIERIKTKTGDVAISFKKGPCDICGHTRLLVVVDDRIAICEFDLHIRFNDQEIRRLGD